MASASLRRGFKSEANGIARQVRAELGLALTEPLDPWALAEHLAIPLVPLSEMAAEAGDAVRYFSMVETGAFSAVTVFHGPSRLIVYNDTHARSRQASDLAHEEAHALLQHPPHAALDERGCRIWTEEFEAEADWLAGALLVSDEAALAIVRRKLSSAEAVQEYGISAAMLRFRLNVTGAHRRVQRADPAVARPDGTLPSGRLHDVISSLAEFRSGSAISGRDCAPPGVDAPTVRAAYE